MRDFLLSVLTRIANASFVPPARPRRSTTRKHPDVADLRKSDEDHKVALAFQLS